MDVLSIGIDIVELRRIRAVYERHTRRFVERVYTPEERRRLEVLRDPIPYLAGRWAVKEAVFKVLGTGLSGGVTWHDVNVLRQPSGAPEARLSGKAAMWAEAMGLKRVLISISHGKEYAVAVATGLGAAERQGPDVSAQQPGPVAEG